MVKNRQPEGLRDRKAIPDIAFARRPGSAFGVEVVLLDELRGRSMDHLIYHPHRVDFHMLLVPTAGHGLHMVDFTEHQLEPGVALHVTPGQVHAYDAGPQLLALLLLFQPEVCGLTDPHSSWPTRIRLADGDARILETLVQLMFDLKAESLVTSADKLTWRLLSAVLEICESAALREEKRLGVVRNELFDRFEAMLAGELGRHRDVGWYAEELGTTEKTLSRWCQRVTGVGAKATIDRRVALEAKRRLAHTQDPVQVIARRLGFTEPTNFAKFFRRVEGETPAAFRERHTAFRQRRPNGTPGPSA